MKVSPDLTDFIESRWVFQTQFLLIYGQDFKKCCSNHRKGSPRSLATIWPGFGEMLEAISDVDCQQQWLCGKPFLRPRAALRNHRVMALLAPEKCFELASVFIEAVYK